LLLLKSILETPELVDRLWDVLEPEPPAREGNHDVA
jgi:hypothetical protein